jgi:hypothetical protein
MNAKERWTDLHISIKPPEAGLSVVDAGVAQRPLARPRCDARLLAVEVFFTSRAISASAEVVP